MIKYIELGGENTWEKNNKIDIDMEIIPAHDNNIILQERLDCTQRPFHMDKKLYPDQGK